MSATRAGWICTGALAAAILLNLLLFPSPSAYASVVLLALFAAVFARARSMDDRALYLLLAGVLLIAVFSAATMWGGLVAAWLVALVVADDTGIRVTRSGTGSILVAAGATVAVILCIDSQNHVLVPLVAICGAAFCIIAVMAVRQYRFRKHYAGGTV